jgi:hypothetical protein
MEHDQWPRLGARMAGRLRKGFFPPWLTFSPPLSVAWFRLRPGDNTTILAEINASLSKGIHHGGNGAGLTHSAYKPVEQVAPNRLRSA